MAVQTAPAEVGIALANWNWKVVRQFIEARRGRCLSRATCLRYLHRLGFVYKRPKKRLLKADEAKRTAFIEQYAALLREAQAAGAKIFFADEAHLRADADLHGKWVLKGRPALVDSSCPRWGEKASYYSAVCLETGETAYRELVGTSTSATSVAFPAQLRADHAGPRIIIWDNGPAHGGEAMRRYLETPDLNHASLPPAGLQPRFQRRWGHLGVGPRRGDRQHLPRDQGGRAGVGRAFLRRPQIAE